MTSGDWLAGEIEEGVVVLGGTFGEKDEPFCPYCGTDFLGPPESRIGTSPERWFLSEYLSHGTSGGSGLDTKDTLPPLLILFQLAEGIGTKS